METIYELAKTYQKIAKTKITSLNITYDYGNDLYVAILKLEDLPFFFKICEDGTVTKHNANKKSEE